MRPAKPPECRRTVFQTSRPGNCCQWCVLVIVKKPVRRQFRAIGQRRPARHNGVVPASDTKRFIAAAKTRQWEREPQVRMLA